MEMAFYILLASWVIMFVVILALIGRCVILEHKYDTLFSIHMRLIEDIHRTWVDGEPKCKIKKRGNLNDQP